MSIESQSTQSAQAWNSLIRRRPPSLANAAATSEHTSWSDENASLFCSYVPPGPFSPATPPSKPVKSAIIMRRDHRADEANPNIFLRSKSSDDAYISSSDEMFDACNVATSKSVVNQTDCGANTLLGEVSLSASTQIYTHADNTAAHHEDPIRHLRKSLHRKVVSWSDVIQSQPETMLVRSAKHDAITAQSKCWSLPTQRATQDKQYETQIVDTKLKAEPVESGTPLSLSVSPSSKLGEVNSAARASQSSAVTDSLNMLPNLSKLEMRRPLTASVAADCSQSPCSPTSPTRPVVRRQVVARPTKVVPTEATNNNACIDIHSRSGQTTC